MSFLFPLKTCWGGVNIGAEGTSSISILLIGTKLPLPANGSIRNKQQTAMALNVDIIKANAIAIPSDFEFWLPILIEFHLHPLDLLRLWCLSGGKCGSIC